jgi:amidase
MKRRDFIRHASMSAISLNALIYSACNAPSSSAPNEAKAQQKDSDFALHEITIEQLQRKMQEGEYTSKKIVELYLERIAAVDKSGPKLNSVIEVNPDAVSIAEALDEERKQGKVRGPLHGIPILIKDNIDTGDKMMTTAGSLAMSGHHAAQDAFIAKKLRNAGAIILGKTNLSEWANFRSTRSSSGWSSRGGQTKNPYILDHNPCGSSSGSGTAVATNLCAIAIGTETNGSIACPSSINGVVGIKPTVGLVSRSGIIPISHTQDTAGPMARTVRDAAIVLNAIAGFDTADTSSADKAEDYTRFLDDNALKGKRIGVEKSFLKGHEDVDLLLQKAIDLIKGKGAEIIVVEVRSKIKIREDELEVLQYEFKDGLNRYLSNTNAPVKSLKDVIDFNTKNAEKVMPYFRQELLQGSEEKKGLDDKGYQEALKKVMSVRGIIDDVLKTNNLDGICGPTNGPSWCTDLVNGDHFTGYGMYSPAAMAGYPHITVPMGLVKGLPVGLTFFSSAYQDASLIGIGYAFEQASRQRVAPEFKASLI